MKKIIALLLVLTMAFSLVACGGSEPTPTEAPSLDDVSLDNAPYAGVYAVTADKATTITLTFEGGKPTHLDGIQMDPSSLLEKLNERIRKSYPFRNFLCLSML